MPRDNRRKIMVKLTYFKTSGKYYSEAKIPMEPPQYSIVHQVRQMLYRGALPGLVPGARFPFILVSGANIAPALVIEPEIGQFAKMFEETQDKKEDGK